MSSNETSVGDDHIIGRASAPRRIPVNLDWLSRQRAMRGWVLNQTLAEAVGVREETISDLCVRASTSPATYEKLLAALKRTPPDETALGLMGESAQGAA